MTTRFPNLEKLLQNNLAGTRRYNFNTSIDPEKITTVEKAFGFEFSAAHKRFLEWFNGGMILAEDPAYYVDMLDNEPDGPIDSSFYLYPLETLVNQYRDLRLDNWLTYTEFSGDYPFVPICITPQSDLIFTISSRRLEKEPPIFFAHPNSNSESIVPIAQSFDAFIGQYLRHTGFPPTHRMDACPSFSDFMESNRVMEKANEFPSYEEAMVQADALIQWQPDNALHYCERGNTRMNYGFRELALEDYNQAIAMQKNNAYFHYCRGDLVFLFGSPRKALIDIDLAVKLEPGDPFYLSKRAHVFLKLSELSHGQVKRHYLQKALKDCNAALDIDMVYQLALMVRYDVYMALGDTDSAEADSALLDDLNRN